jgi:hypothetical protein
MLKSDATRKQDQLEYLALVRALSQAIASAISSIEKNDLRQLESDLAAQESICNRICGTKSTLLHGNSDASWLVEIRQAHMALAQLNRVYAGLLQRVRKSAGLIAVLYRSYGEGYDREPSPLPQQHTWSCEV